MAQAPEAITIRSYQVGFGDCFLVRFHYPGQERDRHILMDFGTTGIPEDAEKDLMVTVAKDIAKQCGGRLEAVFATHRHADHISGFATKADGSGPGDVIKTIDIDTVIQPWTEAPEAEERSLGPEISAPTRGMAARQRGLEAMHETAAAVVAMAEAKTPRGAPKMLKGASKEMLEQIEFIGRDNVKNLSAVENLMRIGKRHVYAWHGSDAGLSELLPGVTTHILGPPTLRQTDTIRKQKSRDPDEYWHFALAGLKADRNFLTSGENNRLFPDHPVRPGSKLPVEVRWIAKRLNEGRNAQFLSMVTQLDKQMNNTSLIVLFEAAGKKLLFPGDAQIENWRFALSKPEILAMLAGVDVYKVGHHGSLNATPKTLWNGFAKKGGKARKDRLITMMSTMLGKHGHDEDDTEVPRRTLVTAMTDESDLHSTHLMPPDERFQEVTIAL